MTKLEFFQNVRINRLVQTLANQLEIAEPLTFLARTPLVNADDDEIVGRYSGPVFAADLITDDAEAVVVEGGRLETTGVTPGTIPNIKIGASVGQGMINRLRLLQRGIQLAGQSDLITGWENQLAQNLVLGVRQTQNYLCAAMFLDGVVYDRLGVKISAGFGTPNTLKVTTGVWTNTAAATPLADIQTMLNVTAPSVGKTYNRVDIATPTLQKIFATDEFATRVRLYLRLTPDQFTLNPYDVANLKALLEAITGVTFNEENSTFRVRNTDGTSTSQRVMPENKVIFSNTADDNNPAAYDFANGIVTESVVAPLIQGAPEIPGGEQFGPVSYYWGNPDLNPPRINAFAVARGFPRKHDIYSHAILTVF